jgi:hypothetical protein
MLVNRVHVSDFYKQPGDSQKLSGLPRVTFGQGHASQSPHVPQIGVFIIHFLSECYTFPKERCSLLLVALAQRDYPQVTEFISNVAPTIHFLVHGQALLIEGRCLFIGSLDTRHFTQIIPYVGFLNPILQFSNQRQGLIEELRCPGVVMLPHRASPQDD